MENHLVVGGDSLIGRHLIGRLLAAGHTVTATSRRPGSVKPPAGRLVEFDLDRDHSRCAALFPERFDCAFLCAGVTGMAVCAAHSARSFATNVTHLAALAAALHARGTRLLYPSSSAVFDGTIAYPDEAAQPDPDTEYGRQKAAAESALLALGGVRIVRLTKVLAAESGVAAGFARHLVAGEAVEAFFDLRLSPLSIEYAVESMLRIAESGRDGIYHLSGADELSYADLARVLARRIGVPADRVRPVSSRGDPAVPFRPRHPALGMARTTAGLGLAPESIPDFLARFGTATGRR